MQEIKTEYKGYEIRYDEHMESWMLYIGSGAGYRNANLAAIKKYIDKLGKKNFKRFKVIISKWSSYSIGTVTSIDTEGEYWVTREDGGREKCIKNELRKHNKSNLEKIKAIEELEKKRDDINKKIDEIKDKFEPLGDEDEDK